MFQQISLLIGAVVLAVGFLIVFFGGTWEGMRIGLEILGTLFILQTTYNVLMKSREEKEQKEELKKKTDKYFDS